MNIPDNTGSQAVNSVQMEIVAQPVQQGLGAVDEEGSFMNCMPNGDPDHVMLWGDDEE